MSKKETVKGPEPKLSLAASIFEWIEMIVMSACVVLLIFTFIARPASVDGHSMENTLHDKELLIISNLFYEPEREDIVVVQKINSAHSAPIVKRVIATEGETVDYDFVTGKVTVTDVSGETTVLDEGDYIKPELPEAYKSTPMDFPITLEEGEMFVMGDNRNNSLDSRSMAIGIVTEDEIVGHVLLRVFPFNKFGTVN
ncbi:MAG: signal peptidase I [Clostridia bacterium]|nr:signal peptidase I [Clostridia bacterium]